MGKSEAAAVVDPKKEEKKARKRAKKEAKEAKKRLKKEQKRREKEAKKRHKKQQKQLQQSLDLIFSNVVESEEVVKDSVFYLKQIVASLSLLPAAMGNIKAHLEDSIRHLLLKYMDGVGLLFTFHNLQIVDNDGHGFILNELPYIHYRIRFDSLVFAPKVGSKLNGKVSESFPSHLGIIVLGYVNAMIPAELLHEAGYIFDHDNQTWSKEDNGDDVAGGSKEDGKKVLSKDDELDFFVAKMHVTMGTLSIEGSMREIGWKDKTTTKQQPYPLIASSSSTTPAVAVDAVETPTNERSRRKSKRQKTSDNLHDMLPPDERLRRGEQLEL